MRFANLILVITLFIFCSCKKDEPISTEATFKNLSPKIVLKDSIILIPEEGLVYYQNQPFSGSSVSYYSPKQMATSESYLSGKREGPYIKWFPSGIKSYECHYVNGKKNGSCKSWWKNGNLRSESTFSKGIAHGEQKQCYKSGAKFKLMHLNQGLEEGMQKSWRENGKIYNNYEAKNGRIFGLKRAALCFQLDNEEIALKGE